MVFGCSEAPFSRLGRLLEAFWSVLEMFWRHLWVLGFDSSFQETPKHGKTKKNKSFKGVPGTNDGVRSANKASDPPTRQFDFATSSALRYEALTSLQRLLKF